MACRATARGLVMIAAIVLSPALARATDEIQVYDASIAAVGQFTIQQHLNYVLRGRTEPDFPGGLVSNHSLNGTPELAYGVTDWYELGFYAPFAVDANGQFLSDGFKIRHLFVSPNADKRDIFYGVNFEFSYQTPKFSQTTYGLEVRPIIGFRHGEYEFIINPIVDFAIGGEADFTPAIRFARKIREDFSLALEYYSDFGQIGHFASLDNQQHTLFAVTDFKVGKIDVEFGVGYGLTPGSDQWVTKLILGYAFDH